MPTLDAPNPGLRDVILTETRLSHVDGEAGRLVIGGFELQELAPQATFEEVLFLLLHDRLPTRAELDELKGEMASHRALPREVVQTLREGARRALGPMDALRLGLDALTAAAEGRDLRSAVRLVAQAPSVLAAYVRLRAGERPLPPLTDLPHAAHFLYSLSGEVPEAARVRALETYFGTTIDHGLNASTFAARVIVSTRADLRAAVLGALGALGGPLHGGAPGPALEMVFEIRRRAAASGRPVEQEAEAWAQEALGRGERLMGFGHRVYRVRDPRADVLAEAARALFEGPGAADAQLYEDARTVEGVLLRVLEAHRPGRRLQTNVEFYTALLLHGVGLTPDLFASIFALSRIGGWVAHGLEQAAEDVLIRPGSSYGGAYGRTWVALAERE